MKTYVWSRNRTTIGVALATVLIAGTTANASVLSTRPVAISGTDSAYGPNMGSGVFYNAGSLGSSSSNVQPVINNSGYVMFTGNISGTTTYQGLWTNPNSSTNGLQALGGQAAPGGAGTQVYGNAYNGGSPTANVFANLGINNAGQTAFKMGTNGAGAFTDSGSGLTRVAFGQDVAPETGSGATPANASYANGPLLSFPMLFNQSGNVAYFASLQSGTGSDPITTSGVFPNVANNNVLYMGQGDNGGGANPNVHAVLRAGDQPAAVASIDPSARIGTNFGSFQANFNINDNNKYCMQVALQGQIGGVNVTTSLTTGNASMYITNRNGSFEIIARQGESAPGGTGTEVYRGLGSSGVGFNNLGHVAFNSSTRVGATTVSSGSVFSDIGSGTLRRIADQGQSLPNIYSRTGNSPLPAFTNGAYNATTSGATGGGNLYLVNGADTLFFYATGLTGDGITSGVNNAAIFSVDHVAGQDVQRVVVQTHDSAPVFTSLALGEQTFINTIIYNNVAVNSLGQMAFMGTLGSTGSSIVASPASVANNSGLFVVDTDGTIHLIAQVGETFAPLGNNSLVVAAITPIGQSGGQDGHSIVLNDNGDLVFSLTFKVPGTTTALQSGVFVTHIPTPESLTLLGLGGLVASRRRRR